jgi:hypothetical protein
MIPIEYSGARGTLIHEKTEVENLVTGSLKAQLKLCLTQAQADFNPTQHELDPSSSES